MTDPLLTIEDASQEPRVSPTTIRRRLTSAEIAGASERPGRRRPARVPSLAGSTDVALPPRS